MIFTTADESFSTATARTALSGLTVVAAPKGTAEPRFFPKNSYNDIIARIGAPMAAYPGIAEAIAYNEQYDLWISAPPGVGGSTYHNYYGGLYLTTRGSLEPFYQVTDPESPNFGIQVTAGGTGAYSADIDITFTPENLPTAAFITLSIDDSLSSGARLSAVAGEYIGASPFTLVHFYASINGAAQRHMIFTLPTVIHDLIGDAGDVVTTGVVYNVTGGAGTLVSPWTVQNVGVSSFVLDHSEGELDFYTDNYELTLSDTATYFDLTGVDAAGDVVVIFTVNVEDDVILTFYQNSPRSSTTTIAVTDFDIANTPGNADYNTMTFTVSELPFVGGTTYTSRAYKISADPEKVDGFNQSLYAHDVFVDNPYVTIVLYQQLTDALIALPSASYTMTGQRIIEDPAFSAANLISTLEAGWAEVTGPDYANVNIFFEYSGQDVLPALRAEYRFATVAQSAKNHTTSATHATLHTALVTDCVITRDTGYTAFCNEFKMKDIAGTFYWDTPIGTAAAMLTAIMEYKLGGVAPMFTNANYNGINLGGQLSGRAVYKQKFNLDATDLDNLDTAGFNPIILDPSYGLMITSQKTRQTALTDWSYLGHQMSFDLFRKEVRENVMMPQLGKPINGFYMNMRKTQTQAILNKRLTGTGAIWSAGAVYVEEVNTEETRLANKFVIKVRVKVTPFSEYVELIFNNVAQNASV